MAKGQKRSGREPRKPKAEKPKPPIVISAGTAPFQKR
ncbi:hypothetical protein [Caulobacter sp. 17J65-9]|nr:hypothetical protein [Caulobacter sp. 17J65-9]